MKFRTNEKKKGEKDQMQSHNKAKKSNTGMKREWAYLKEASSRGSTTTLNASSERSCRVRSLEKKIRTNDWRILKEVKRRSLKTETLEN